MDTQIRTLIAYNEWANGKVLAAMSAVHESDRGRAAGASFGSIRETMLHVLTAQNTWLTRLGSPVAAPALHAASSIADAFVVSHDAMRQYAAMLSTADLAAAIDYTDSQGVPHRRLRAQLLTHVVHHGTHHRAEAGMLLAALSHSPGDMDFLYFVPDLLE